MLDPQSQATLDIRTERGVEMVAKVWGYRVEPTDEDFETAAKDAISDVLTAAFGPAGHMLACSDGDGFTKVTNEEAYVKASMLADAAVSSYFGDGEDYVRTLPPKLPIADVDVVVIRDPDSSNEIRIFGDEANVIDIDLGADDLYSHPEWLEWVSSRQSDSERVATKQAQALIAETVRVYAEKFDKTEPYWVADILDH